MEQAPKTKRAKIDWEAVTADWRVGKMTERQMEELHHVSRQAMRKRFTKLGIKRDLSSVVRAATKAALVQSSSRLSDPEVVQGVVSEVVQDFESRQLDAVKGAVSENVRVIESHKGHAGRLTDLLLKMTGELESITDDPQSLEQIAESLSESDPQSAKAIKKLKSLTTRINNVKTASETLGKLVTIQRQAHNIDDGVDETAKRFGEGAAMGAADAYARMLNG